MIDCISVDNMRCSDALTIEKYVSSLELMYRAAYGVFLANTWISPVAIVVGSGNNGGDGFALSCILKEKSISCTVFTLSNRLSEDSRFYADKAVKAGVPVFTYESNCLNGFATVVDCLLGTGFQGTPRQNYCEAIHAINASGAFIVSVDINSGMNGDSGEVEIAVKSDLTVTIGFVKNGLITENAGKYMRHLVCTDIGIQLAKTENKICTVDEWEDKEGYFLCPHWLDMECIKVC